MSEYKNREELEHEAMEALDRQQAEAERGEYVERPKSQRVLAWVLAGIVIAGVILYYFWIFKGGVL